MSDESAESKELATPEVSKEVLEWERFAEMDYVTAVHLDKTLYPKPMEIICYHCQQCTEKYLKALTEHLGKEIEKTHDLGNLATTISESRFPCKSCPRRHGKCEGMVQRADSWERKDGRGFIKRFYKSCYKLLSILLFQKSFHLLPFLKFQKHLSPLIKSSSQNHQIQSRQIRFL